MSYNKKVEDNFLRSIQNYQLRIRKDHGEYRHLQYFQEVGSNNFLFEIMTFPDHLLYTGCGGTFLFKRHNTDMFYFFIMDKNDFNKVNVINPHYWSEKLCGDTSTIKKFSYDKFETYVKEQYDSFCEEFYAELSGEDKQNLWDDLESSILMGKDAYEEDDYDEWGIDVPYNPYDVIRSYKFADFNLNCSEKFAFNTDEINFDEFTNEYLWACYAIVYAIKDYNSKVQM